MANGIVVKSGPRVILYYNVDTEKAPHSHYIHNILKSIGLRIIEVLKELCFPPSFIAFILTEIGIWSEMECFLGGGWRGPMDISVVGVER